MTTQHQAPEVTSEPDLSWIDIAVCRNATVIADFSPGWREFFNSADLHIEDCVDTGTSMPTEVGLYRWSGYRIGYWDEGDLANLSGGTFTRATQPLSLTVDWPADAEFQLGDLVQKKGRASWRGHVRGWYRTELTALGYAVESMYEPGSVQIYPASALDRLQSLSLPVDIDRSGLAQEVE